MNKPIKTIRLGGVQGSIWKNDKGDVTASYSKSYKTKDGEWKSTTYFNAEDTALLIAVAHKTVTVLSELREKKPVVTGQQSSIGDDDIPF